MDSKDDEKEKKKQRNRMDYLRNRASILTKARHRYHEKKVILFPIQHTGDKLATTAALDASKKRRKLQKSWAGYHWVSGRLVEHGLILGVILLSTFFLLRETVAFLSQTEGVSSAWLKALVGEGLVISLSAMRFTSWPEKSAKAVLLLVLFGYNAAAIVGGLWTQGQSKMTQSSVAIQTVMEIEAEIQKKETIRSTYVKAGADILARRYDRQIDALHDKLAIARAEMLKNPSAENVRTTFSVLAFFRLIVLVGNSFLITQFSAFFRRRIVPVGQLRLC